MYKYYQPNKKDIKDNYGDCVIRAICKATDKAWVDIFDQLNPIARELQCPINCRPVYEKFFEQHADFTYVGISNKKGKMRPIVKQIALKSKNKIIIMRIAHHLVTAKDGHYYDTWDCGTKSLYGYWEKTIRQ